MLNSFKWIEKLASYEVVFTRKVNCNNDKIDHIFYKFSNFYKIRKFNRNDYILS